MKIIALIPYWSDYAFPENSLQKRDTLNLGGQSLMDYIINTLGNVERINTTIIFSSSKQVENDLRPSKKLKFLERSKDLDNLAISIEDIIENFLDNYDADIVVLVHPRCPFLKAETINNCIQKVTDDGFDSCFIVSKEKKLAWFNGKPLNYSLNESTPNLKELEPVILETSSLYVFSRKLFQKTRSRVGGKSYMYDVGNFEGFEVNRKEDFEMAELIINSGLDKLRK